jgi:hypothetical protein
LTWERLLDILSGPKTQQEVIMSVIGDERLDTHGALSNAARENVITPWRLEIDPFANASPLVDLSTLAGGLPDERDAEEILRDLDLCRRKRVGR